MYSSICIIFFNVSAWDTVPKVLKCAHPPRPKKGKKLFFAWYQWLSPGQIKHSSHKEQRTEANKLNLCPRLGEPNLHLVALGLSIVDLTLATKMNFVGIPQITPQPQKIKALPPEQGWHSEANDKLTPSHAQLWLDCSGSRCGCSINPEDRKDLPGWNPWQIPVLSCQKTVIGPVFGESAWLLVAKKWRPVLERRQVLQNRLEKVLKVCRWYWIEVLENICWREVLAEIVLPWSALYTGNLG